jgi:LysR family glycine cleavage system transcriptional activator
MQAGQSSKSLTIAAPRDLTAKWLMPRLAEIARSDTEIRFMLISADEDIDFTEANIDLAIRWGVGPGEHEGEALESDGMVTVARPGGGADVKISWPGCLAEDAASLVRVSDAGLALDAAAEGLGTATVPELIARLDLVSGRVVAVGEAKSSRYGYWLVAPLPQWRQKKVKALVEKLGE